MYIGLKQNLDKVIHIIIAVANHEYTHPHTHTTHTHIISFILVLSLEGYNYRRQWRSQDCKVGRANGQSENKTH